MFALILSFSICGSGVSQDMSNSGLHEILKEEATKIDGEDGAWSFTYEEQIMLMLTDEGHNRMRIICPIMEVANLTHVEMASALIANFHSALDVKYAISEDLVWSVYLHPLRELSEEQVKDALKQVARAAETFGTSYSSTDLFFPGGGADEKDNSDDKSKPKKKM